MRIFTKLLSLSILLWVTLFLSQGCKDPIDIDQRVDQFDRTEMLTDWADLIIIPSYVAYVQSLNALVEANSEFTATPNNTNLFSLRDAYINCYKAWQSVSMFEIGKAEELQLLNFTNIYPTNEGAIHSNIDSGTANLELPSNFDAQGLPAIDYLLYGLSSNDSDLINLLSDDAGTYLTQLIVRLQILGHSVLTDWQDGYRETFIQNTGSSATASVDKIVNDYLFYYERFLRAGKVGLPAGVFTGSALPRLVEAPYSKIYSKDLLILGFEASRNFFNGISYNGQNQGISLVNYLDYIYDNNTTGDVSSLVNAQWPVIEDAINLLSDDLYGQIETDNAKMLSVYDELQKNVITLKVDMMQALNIQVDFVDADGD